MGTILVASLVYKRVSHRYLACNVSQWVCSPGSHSASLAFDAPPVDPLLGLLGGNNDEDPRASSSSNLLGLPIVDKISNAINADDKGGRCIEIFDTHPLAHIATSADRVA